MNRRAASIHEPAITALPRILCDFCGLEAHLCRINLISFGSPRALQAARPHRYAAEALRARLRRTLHADGRDAPPTFLSCEVFPDARRIRTA